MVYQQLFKTMPALFLFCYVVKTAFICPKSDWNNYMSGKKLQEFPIKILDTMGLNSCYKECKAHGKCLSINFNRKLFVCELLSEKQSESKTLTDDQNYVYMEITDIIEKTCDGGPCNNYSTCIRTSLNNSLCIATDCSEVYPDLDDGAIADRTFTPISATYGCNVGFTGVGSVKRVTCIPGGKWSSLSYRCEPPVHGGWGSWGSWGYCPVTCGGGTRYRYRSCNNPTPMYGGNICYGSSSDSVYCNTNGCPVNGGWGYWSGWSSCSKTCETGLKSRSRSCNNPYPAYGGAGCSGDSSQSSDCNTDKCPGWLFGRR
nr:thrombospondin-2 [Crassostrea gigas]